MNTEETYKTFTGKEPRGKYQIQLPKECRPPRQVAELGEVSELRGMRLGFPFICEFVPPAKLLATPRGKLYIYDSKGRVHNICEVEIIYYISDKWDTLQLYMHTFDKPRPELKIVKNSRDRLGKLAGGSYRIESGGICH